MMARRLWIVPVAAALLAGASALGAAAEGGAPEEDRVLQAAGLPTDGPGLLAYLRRRSTVAVSAEEMSRLVHQLGSASVPERQRAREALLGLGPLAIPALRQAANSPDEVERARQARQCLKLLEEDGARLTAAALAALTRCRPAGAVATLLDFLPVAENQEIVAEVRACLGRLAYGDGGPDPELTRALEDPRVVCRATALEVLCQQGQAVPREALLRFLDDADPGVRLRAALALARLSEERAAESLIELLVELPGEEAYQAESWLQQLAGEETPDVGLGGTEEERRACREAWRRWWASRTGPELVEEVRKRTLGGEQHDRVQELIRRLGDEAFAAREGAVAALKEVGSAAIPLLRRALGDEDPEVVARVQRCLEAIEGDAGAPLSAVTLRLLAYRKPAGAVRALLDYLPGAEEEQLVELAQGALNALAQTPEQVDPVLLEALKGARPVRRGAAAEALCQRPGPASLELVRPLLRDPEPGVRLQVALALAGRRQAEAVPVLIDLLAELPADRADAAEGYLTTLAEQGPAAPEVDVTGLTEQGAWRRRRDAWAAWWRAHGGSLALPPARRPVEWAGNGLRGILVVLSANGMVGELEANGKLRWQIGGLQGPHDAQVLPGGNILIAELNGQRVTERTRAGTVVWEQKLAGYPVGARRLAGGHTLVVARNEVVELDRKGKAVFSFKRPGNDLMTGERLPGGDIVCLTSQGQLLQVDRRGKETVRATVPGVATFGNDILPTGGVVVAGMYQNQVIEYDARGRVVWQASVTRPSSVCRLASGNTLVATQSPSTQLVELDRRGKVVREIATPGYVIRAYRR